MALATRNKNSKKPFAAQSEICHCGRLQLKLELVCDEGNKFGIRGFSFGIADRISKESLQSVQIASVPGHFDGVADSPLHTAGGSLEGFGDLWVQYLGDGVDHIHIVHRNDNGLPQVLVALDMGRHTDLMDVWLPPHKGGFIALFITFDNYCLLVYSNDSKTQLFGQVQNQ